MIWAWICGALGAGAALAAVILFITEKVVPWRRKMFRFWDRITGVPEDVAAGQEAEPGLFEILHNMGVKQEAQAAAMAAQVAAMAAQVAAMADQDVVLEKIRHEVQLNDGSSVKDAVRRIENHLAAQQPPPDDHSTTTINIHPPEGTP